MARILIMATHGSEDPTRAGLAFLFAKGAVEAGHKPEVLLAGDAFYLRGRSTLVCGGARGDPHRCAATHEPLHEPGGEEGGAADDGDP